MCRSGRVFRPEVDGQKVSFVVIGANYYNAVLEDLGTRSWWYQATGAAVTGPLEGKVLPEVPSEQMTLGEWLQLYPDSVVFQPDPDFEESYSRRLYIEWDSSQPDPEKHEHEREGEMGEWVVCVFAGGAARAYPWLALRSDRLIQDEVGGVPIAIHLRADGLSFRAWERRTDQGVLVLRLDLERDVLIDEATGSSFGFDGIAADGPLEGQALKRARIVQERWHSIRRFYAGVDRYEPAEKE